MVSVMGRSRSEQRYRQPRRTPTPSPTNPSSPNPPAMSQQQAGEILGLPYLSPTSRRRVITQRAPRAFMGEPYEGTYENYMAMMQKRLKAVEKIQAAFRNPDQFRKKVRIGRLGKKASNLAQRRNLLQEEDRLRRYLLEEEDRIRGQLNAMRKNSPSPPRGNKKIRLFNNNPTYRKKMLELRNKYNPKPRGFSARASRKITQLYTNGGAKRVRDKKRLYKEKMMKIATEKSPPKRKRPPRQVQKPRKKKKPTRTTNNPTIAQIQRNLLANSFPKPNAATAKNARRARIEKRRGLVQIKKRYTLTDLITGKIKTFTKKGWYDRAVAKQQILRMRICA